MAKKLAVKELLEKPAMPPQSLRDWQRMRWFNPDLYDWLMEGFLKDFPYQLPKPFNPWSYYLELLNGVCFVNYLTTKAMEAGLMSSFDSQIFERQTRNYVLCLADKPPVYCISDELVQQFMKSDISEADVLSFIAEDWEPPILRMILCLPGMYFASEDLHCDGINFLLISYEKNAQFLDGEILNTGRGAFVFSSVTSQGVLMNGCTLLSNVTEELKTKLRIPGHDYPLDRLAAVKSFVFQVMLSLSFMPDLLEEPAPLLTSPRSNGGSNKTKRHNYLQPRWIGRLAKSRKSIGSEFGKGSSPSSHWRRGHWRMQPCGKKSLERKPIFVKPVFVNPVAGDQA